MKTLIRWVCLLLLASSSFGISACGAAQLTPLQQPAIGEVWLLAQNSTVYWVNQAFNSANFTQIMTNGQGSYFILWNPTNLNGVGFTLVNEAGTSKELIMNWVKATGGKGSLVNFHDVSGVVDYMKAEGWKTITAAEVPVALKATWAGFYQTVSMGLTIAGNSLISILIVPVGIMPTYEDATIMG